MSIPGGSIPRQREAVLADALATVVRYLHSQQRAAACDPDATLADGVCVCPRCQPRNAIIMQAEKALLYQEENNHA